MAIERRDDRLDQYEISKRDTLQLIGFLNNQASQMEIQAPFNNTKDEGLHYIVRIFITYKISLFLEVK